MKEILDVIHDTIYQFFDVCGDDEEAPMSDKDKLLLEVNKARCNNLKALEQEPKTGHWINGDSICPCCGEDKFKDLDADIWSDWQPKYCPNCGAKMVEPQESEVNNG